MNRALRAAWPALTIVLALAASIATSAAATGGSSPVLVVRAAVLVLLGLAVATLLGAIVAAARVVDDVARGRLLDVGAAAAAIWTVLAAVTTFLLYLGQAPAVDSPAFGPGLVAFVLELDLGRTWLIGAALAAVLTALLVGVRSRTGVVPLGVATVLAAVPVALQSAMSGDPLGTERSVVTAGLVQLVGVGTWIGALGLTRSRRVPVVAFGAVLVGVGATVPALVADGSVSAVGASGAVLVVLAGVAAVLGAALRRDLRIPQLLLLGIGVGLGVAAAVTRTAPDVPARTTPAEILTGSSLPRPPSFGPLVASWQPDAVWLVVAVGLLVGYLIAVRHVRTPWPVARTVSWLAGVVVLAWLTCCAPAEYATVLLAAHLAQHVALLLVVPLLLAGGAPLRLLAAADHPRTFPTRTGAVARTGPVSGAIVALLVLLALYGTGLLRWSVSDPIGTEVGVAGCLLAGCLAVSGLVVSRPFVSGPLVGAVGAPGGRRRVVVVVCIVLLALETAGAVLLGTAGGLLAADWYGAMGWGTDALAAQHAAAALAWPIAAVPTALLLIAALRASASPLARAEVVPA